MASAVIVCNGEFPRKEYPLYLLRSAGSVICCDGALSALEKRGIVPDVVIGDMDSVCPRALGRFPGKIVKVSEQDDNDLAKAFSYLMSASPLPDEVHILAATGLREDHTLGNYGQLMEFEKKYRLQKKGIAVDMVSDRTSAFVISDSCELFVGEGRSVSIFTPDPSLRIKSSGLEYPTDDVVFDNWWKASLNHAVSDSITLTLSHSAPVLLILC